MRVAVTGATGFVGRHLCEHLRSRGDVVWALGGPKTAGADGRVDITDERGLAGAFASFVPDAIVHLAGAAAVGLSHGTPVETFRVNALGTVSLCAAARAAAPRARILIVGSGEMYGPTAPGTKAREDDRLAPSSPYAASKVAAEVAAMQFHRSYGLPVVAARSFNHLGAGQSTDFAIPAFAKQLAAMPGHGTLSVGNLEPIRDFLHVADVVRAYRLLLERGVSGEAYNVASGEGRTIRSIVEEMVAASGVDAKIVVDATRVRPAELPCLVGDASKLRALGWRPERTVGEALADALADARL
jgi:GDP-4-dehydro-6-deoxy-D-mannose reductase